MSRDKILASIRKHQPESLPLPPLKTIKPEGINLQTLFEERVLASGGECFYVQSLSDVSDKINQLFPKAEKIYTNVKDNSISTIQVDTIKSPQDFENTDLAVLTGSFGVAENGAIWVDDQDVPFRSICFITQHLVLIIHKNNLCHNMLEAYQKLGIQMPGFGCFISGPSKTADIEQSLVIGAHGARSLVVLVVDEK